MKFNLVEKLMMLLAVSLAFALLGYGICAVCAGSVLEPIRNAWSLISSEQVKSETENSIVDLYGASRSSDGADSNEAESDSSDSFKDESEEEDVVYSSTITFPRMNYKFGEISIEGTSIQNVSLIYGDSKTALKNGVGMYMGSSFPGTGSTVLIAGHNNRDFHALQEVQVGQLITVNTTYGEYVYRVTETAIKKNTDTTAYDLSADYENIVLYTCYPFDKLSLTTERYFVYGEFVSGPKVLLDR